MGNNIGQTLQEDQFNEIFYGFQTWHISNFIKLLNKNNNKGGVLPFVRGLRLSAQIIYAIREIISDKPHLDANWGHIVDKDENFCSRECDIIIHKKGQLRKWNGKGNVMDFRFIKNEHALIVISCKSFVDSSVIAKEKTYCNEMKKYVKKIWLFGECCTPSSIDALTKKSKQIGFKNFWHSYTWNKKTDEVIPNYKGWNNFVKEIKKIK
jgi:predicted nucleic acid-binding Zn ribbon protein